MEALYVIVGVTIYLKAAEITHVIVNIRYYLV